MRRLRWKEGPFKAESSETESAISLPAALVPSATPSVLSFLGVFAGVSLSWVLSRYAGFNFGTFAALLGAGLPQLIPWVMRYSVRVSGRGLQHGFRLFGLPIGRQRRIAAADIRTFGVASRPEPSRLMRWLAREHQPVRDRVELPAGASSEPAVMIVELRDSVRRTEFGGSAEYRRAGQLVADFLNRSAAHWMPRLAASGAGTGASSAWPERTAPLGPLAMTPASTPFGMAASSSDSAHALTLAGYATAPARRMMRLGQIIYVGGLVPILLDWAGILSAHDRTATAQMLAWLLASFVLGGVTLFAGVRWRHRFTIDAAGVECAETLFGRAAGKRRRWRCREVERFETMAVAGHPTVCVVQFDGARVALADDLLRPMLGGWDLWRDGMTAEQRAQWLADLLNREAERLWPEPVERAAKAGKAET